jgi:uncharacterized protein (DUF1330 family)
MLNGRSHLHYYDLSLFSTENWCAKVHLQPNRENFMKTQITVALAMLAGIGIGAVGIHGVDAQGKAPGAYAIVDITEVTDPEGFKKLIPIAGPAMEKSGGKYIVRTDKITSLDGTPPKRVVVIAFDSVDQAKAWNASPAQKEVDAIRTKTTKSRVFIAEGM